MPGSCTTHRMTSNAFYFQSAYTVKRGLTWRRAKSAERRLSANKTELQLLPNIIALSGNSRWKKTRSERETAALPIKHSECVFVSLWVLTSMLWKTKTSIQSQRIWIFSSSNSSSCLGVQALKKGHSRVAVFRNVYTDPRSNAKLNLG